MKCDIVKRYTKKINEEPEKFISREEYNSFIQEFDAICKNKTIYNYGKSVEILYDFGGKVMCYSLGYCVYKVLLTWRYYPTIL